MFSLDSAIQLASEAHAGQKDKAGESYILHPLRVMMAVRELGEDAMIVAVLHDAVEDTTSSEKEIQDEMDKYKRLGMTEFQLSALDLLTHRPGVSYEDYIEGVKSHPIATAIKIKDLEDNIDITRIKNRRNLKDKDLARLNKYLKAWSYLTGK